MGRDDLLREIASASGPEGTATAIFHANVYLTAHPDDRTVSSALKGLMVRESMKKTVSAS